MPRRPAASVRTNGFGYSSFWQGSGDGALKVDEGVKDAAIETAAGQLGGEVSDLVTEMRQCDTA